MKEQSSMPEHIVEEIRNGITDSELMQRHELDASELRSLLDRLVEEGHITQQDLDARNKPEITKPPSTDSSDTRQLLSFWDRQIGQTNIVAIVLVALFCGALPMLFGLIGLAECKEPKARRNAKILVIVSGTLMGGMILLLLIARVL